MHEIKVPSTGESVTSAEIAQWLKSDGEAVTADEIVISIDTDKASVEVEAGADGILHIKVAEGEEVAVGTVIGTIEEGAVADSTGSDQEPEKPEEGSAAEAKPVASEPAEKSDSTDDPRATPVAAKIAEEKGIDLSAIKGTGAGGKITKADVLAADSSSQSEAQPEPELTVVSSPAPAEPAQAPEPTEEKRTTRKKMSPLRRKIAAQLVSAQQEAAILTTFNECDMSAVMSLRKRVQESFIEKHGVKLGFMSFFIKAVVEALKSVPQINAQVDGNEIVQNHFYDIGVAVGTEKGLIVPVIRDCDRKDFAEIEKAIGEYAAKARDGKIQLSDIQGGVFTISNGGIYGSLLSTPILNPPQSGILGMHTIQQRPIAVDGEVVIRPMMNLALSYDHRIVDGKEAVTFLIRVKECIEAPERLLVGA